VEAVEQCSRAEWLIRLTEFSLGYPRDARRLQLMTGNLRELRFNKFGHIVADRINVASMKNVFTL